MTPEPIEDAQLEPRETWFYDHFSHDSERYEPDEERMKERQHGEDHE